MTTRTEYDPLKELAAVQKRMNQLFENAMARTNFDASEGLDTWSPVCDVYETRDSLMMTVELPGMTRDQINVRIDGDEIVVEGRCGMGAESRAERFHRVERESGSFSRRFRLPSTADRDSIQATYRDGLLTVTIANHASGPADPVRIVVG